MDNNSIVIGILAAMITPAILILACGSLSLTTSQRLSRSINRKRSLASELKEIKHGNKSVTSEEQTMLHNQLKAAAKRSVLLQWSMTLLYTAMGFFIATSLFIGLFELFDWERTWMVSVLSITGVVILFSASVTLILETRLALRSVREEMEFLISASPEHTVKKSNDDRRNFKDQ